jgi:hypothetical protein
VALLQAAWARSGPTRLSALLGSAEPLGLEDARTLVAAYAEHPVLALDAHTLAGRQVNLLVFRTTTGLGMNPEWPNHQESAAQLLDAVRGVPTPPAEAPTVTVEPGTTPSPMPDEPQP